MEKVFPIRADKQATIPAVTHVDGSGRLQTVWRCDQSPRVTCPQLVQRDGKTQLLLTTASEGMPQELRARCRHAGCLFIAETDFQGLNENPVYTRSSAV